MRQSCASRRTRIESRAFEDRHVPAAAARAEGFAVVADPIPNEHDVDDDLELTFENGTLAIAGKRGEQICRYDVAVGDTIDPDAIEAKLDKGVLTVHADKRPEAKPRKILVATPDKALDSGESK